MTAVAPHTQQKKVNENPFYLMTGTLEMLQNVSKLTSNPSRSVISGYLNNAWKECKDSLNKRQMFFSVLFSFGDITNREHNVFAKVGIKNLEAGGEGMRRVFLYCLEWMHTNTPSQFYKFLPLYGEYYNLGAVKPMIWTDRWKGTVIDTYTIPLDVDKLTSYIASVLRDKHTTDNELRLWAKWLWHIPTTKRTRKFVVTEKGLSSVKKKRNADAKVGDIITYKGNKLDVTIAKDKLVLACIEQLSTKMDWEVRKFPNNLQFVGYKQFRSKWLVETESVLFSTGRIKEYDKTQLLAFFDQLPGSARHRVQTRIVSKENDKLTPKVRWVTSKGLNVGEVYLEWLKGKKALRNLSTEQKEVLAPQEFKKMEKQAKAHVGGESLINILVAMFTGASTTQEANLKAHSLLEAMKLLVPVLICADISGSMSSNTVTYKGVQFTPNGFVKLLTTVFLLKNPDPELQEMFITFDNECEVIANGQTGEAAKGDNRYMGNSMQTVDNLIDSGEDFITNFKSVSKWIISRNGTHFNVVADGLKKWVDASPGFRSLRIDMINKYPVFLVLSNSAFNSHEAPSRTILDFQSKMRQWFGWEGVVVIWDVCMAVNQKSHFEGLTNVIHYIGFNPSMVTAIFTQLHDLDIIDIYSVLETYYKTNRYAPVRELVD